MSSEPLGIPRVFRLYFFDISVKYSVEFIQTFLPSRIWKISGINAWMVFDLTHWNSPHAHTLLLHRDIWKAAVAGAISYHNRGLKNSSPEFLISIQISSNQHQLNQWFSGSNLIIINAAFLLFCILNNNCFFPSHGNITESKRERWELVCETTTAVNHEVIVYDWVIKTILLLPFLLFCFDC